MARTLKALVVGGGIGGLAAGIALRQAGLEVVVYERATEWSEIGAGIVLAPNGMSALAHLGLADRIAAYGLPMASAAIKTSTGAAIFRAIDETPSFANVCLHRTDLQRALVEASVEDDLRLGHELVDFEQRDDAVAARFANGEQAEGDLLVGADGLHSAVRAGIHGREKPRYAGYAAWRAVARFETDQGVSESWGPGRRFGIVPIGGGRVYWFATQNSAEGRPELPDARKRLLLELFAGWHRPIEALVEATDPGAILRHDLYDRKPLRPPWGVGRATLLGDAAHPTTPNLGQGACLAIEDAVVLAHHLRGAEDLSGTLRRYEALRAPRTAALANLSWRLGQIGQLENPVACWLRNTLLWLVPSDIQRRRMEQTLRFELEA